MEYQISLIEYIKKKYGLPCYVFDEKEFRLNYNHLLGAMRRYYPKYEIAYSYKTNYAPRLCSIVKEMGGFAEVVSDMEYEIARIVGYANPQIIYNGPFKGPKMEEHLLNCGIVNIDNLEEVNRVISLAERNKRNLKVGIRVNISVGQSFVSRFGIDTDSDDFALAVNLLKKCKWIRLVGLHCHVGQSRSLDAWKSRTIQMLDLADKYIDDIPEFIDLGSGMTGDMAPDLKAQFSVTPSYEEYALVSAKTVADHYANVLEEKKPILFTEPGTTIDNRYVDLISEVDSIKSIKNNDFAILNCSFQNLGDVAGSVKLPIQVFSKQEVRHDYPNLFFVGYTCLERDILYKGFSGKLAKGDYIVFGNVGGYSNVDKPPFILPQCAMIGFTGSDWYTIKRRETTKDILSTYVL